MKDLIKEINTTLKKENIKTQNIVNDDIIKEMEKRMNKQNVTSIKPLHVKYEGKKAAARTNNQYLSKLKTVYKMMFNEPINESIIDELKKLMDGKTYNQGVINHIQFFKNIDKIIKLIQNKYTKLNTLSSYINAITSILSRVREYFPNEYNKIAQLNIDLSKQYQRERDTNDAPDKVINNLISFDEQYINKLLSGITNINDKALIAVYTLTDPRRIMDYQLMKITYEKNFDKLNQEFNYIVFENDKPSLFIFYNHKTKTTQQPKITIPNDLSKILDTYIKSNDMVKNDFLFGRSTTDFKQHYIQSKFTKLLQKTFFKYTGKKISVDLIRTSKSTYLDNQPISLAERKKIASNMGHSLLVNMQYSKNMGVQRLNQQPTTTPATIEKPELKRSARLSKLQAIDYDENK